MNREEFLRLAAAGYNRIPLACETLADFDTPLSIYLKLADQPNSYLLESVQGGEKWGRYSMIGLPSRTVMRVHGYHVSILQDGVEVESHDVEDPLAFVESFKDRYKVADIPGLPRFNGAWSATLAMIVCVTWKSALAPAPTRTRWACRISC